MIQYTVVADNGAVYIARDVKSPTEAVNKFLTQVTGQEADMPFIGPSNLSTIRASDREDIAWRLEWDNGFGFNISLGGK